MATAQQLTDAFGAWADARWGADDGTRCSDVELFLDWRTNYSTGNLTDFAKEDLDEFLLEWCPRKLSAPPEAAASLCRATGQYVEFLSVTGRGLPGAGRAAGLIAHAESLTDRVQTAMADPANFGMAKSLFFGSGFELPDTPSSDELQTWLDQRMAEHNALPFDERRALTDRLLMAPLRDLPFAYLPAPASEVAASAAAAPFLQTLHAFCDYLGPDGHTLTARGHLTLADARALVERLGTGDTMDPVVGGRTWKTTSSHDLRGMQYVVETALAAGAVRKLRGRLVPVKAWARRTPLLQLTAVWEALLDHGFLSISPARSARWGDIDELVETGLPHWLIMTVPLGSTSEVAELVATVNDVIAEESPTSWQPDATGRVDVLLRRAEDLGLLHWDGWETEPTEFGTGSRRVGGVIESTPVGRHLAAGAAERIGYHLDVLDLASSSVRELLDALGTNPDLDTAVVVGQWHPGDPDRDKARRLADALLEGSDAADRLHAFDVYETLGPEASGDAVRRLLDTPASGYAAVFLLNHGLATDEQVGGLVSLTPIVDTLAAVSDDPDVLAAAWQQVVESSPSPDDMLRQLWHHAAPETAVVLEALAKVLPKPEAKAVRKALLQHRSWLAQR